MGDNGSYSDEIVRLSRLALSAREQDVRLFVRRLARRAAKDDPKLSEKLQALLQNTPTRSSPLRREAPATVPVDIDSRLELLRLDHVTELDVEPVLEGAVGDALTQIVSERRNARALAERGLTPTKSLLLTGPPGVGKTLAAHWLARELSLPLLTLDLSAVMSSFLGRTGNNVRFVLDYAKSVDCILLLDELDAIAKRRDDSTEVGELKRLVTVLLQEIDDWPPEAFLVAATNHENLLDPAVWRRFDVVLEMPIPNRASIAIAIERFLGPQAEDLREWRDALVHLFHGSSFSDIQRDLLRARRRAAVEQRPSEEALLDLIRRRTSELSRAERAEIATRLVADAGLSQRRAHDLTGVSRDTIRKALHEQAEQA